MNADKIEQGLRLILAGLDEAYATLETDAQDVIARSLHLQTLSTDDHALVTCVHDVTAAVGHALARLDAIHDATRRLYANLSGICDLLDVCKAGRPC